MSLKGSPIGEVAPRLSVAARSTSPVRVARRNWSAAGPQWAPRDAMGSDGVKTPGVAPPLALTGPSLVRGVHVTLVGGIVHKRWLRLLLLLLVVRLLHDVLRREGQQAVAGGEG